MNEIPPQVIRKFMDDHDAELKFEEDDWQIWKRKSIVKKVSRSRGIDFDEFEDLAIVLFRISHWDFDLWIGENVNHQ